LIHLQKQGRDARPRPGLSRNSSLTKLRFSIRSSSIRSVSDDGLVGLASSPFALAFSSQAALLLSVRASSWLAFSSRAFSFLRLAFSSQA
jgi:hypothetical protein